MSCSMATVVPPPMTAIVNILDVDDDEILLISSPPLTLSRRNRRTSRSSSGTNVNNPISVDQNSDQNHNHVAVLDRPLSSRKRTRKRISPITIDLSGDDSLFHSKIPGHHFQNTTDENDVQFICSVKKDTGGITITEPGETSSSSNSTIPTFMCEICVEPKPYTTLFLIMGGCSHSYCSDCIVRYIASKLQDNITQIRCPTPSCPGLLEHDQCRSLLPKEVFDRWGDALCEAVLLANLKYYCPFKDCSAPLLIEGDEKTTITESECPNCRRMFCVKCKVSWHSGINCEEFQNLDKGEREKEDILLVQLAKNKKWIRCSKCKFYVEKSDGCLFMKCRCGNTFCYNCGAPLKSHYCSQCKH